VSGRCIALPQNVAVAHLALPAAAAAAAVAAAEAGLESLLCSASAASMPAEVKDCLRCVGRKWVGGKLNELQLDELLARPLHIPLKPVKSHCGSG
jgi:hypothetical protein